MLFDKFSYFPYIADPDYVPYRIAILWHSQQKLKLMILQINR